MSAVRPAPHNLQAEEQFLSSCLLDGADALSRALNAGLTPEMFYSPANRRVFEHLVGMLSAGQSIDLAVLAQEMAATKQLEAIGGYAYLTKISALFTTSAQLGYFVTKIRELHTLRETIKEATRLVEQCHECTGDIGEAINGPITRLLALASGSENEAEPKWSGVVDEAEKVLSSILSSGGLPPELIIPFPWPGMNERFNPMQRGQLVVLGARPSIGKSSLARPIALHAARNRHYVYFVTLEVNPAQVPLQMAAALVKQGIRGIAKAHVKDQADLRNALRGLRDLGITISRRDRSIARIIGRARALHARGELDLLVIDHGLLVDEVAMAGKDERIAVISSFTKALKRLATELNVVVLLLWQLNRASAKEGNREPALPDLKDCGSLEEDADKVLFIHRPGEDPLTKRDQSDSSLPEEQPRFYQNIIQAKGRDDGTAGMSFYFERSTASFDPILRTTAA